MQILGDFDSAPHWILVRILGKSFEWKKTNDTLQIWAAIKKLLMSKMLFDFFMKEREEIIKTLPQV